MMPDPTTTSHVAPGGIARRTLAWASLLLALHAVLATAGLHRVGFTNDETAHLTAGFAYWKFGDFRLQPENGNLPQRWGALPLLLLQPHLDPADAPQLWHQTELWLLADRFLFGSGNDPERLLRWARWVMMFWPLATGVLVFAWSRRLWGDAGGLLSLALYALSPTVLAHGPLVTSDSTATFCLLAAVGAFWRALRRGGHWIAVSGLATGLAFVAKFTCVLLLPAFCLIGLWHLAKPGARSASRGAAARQLATVFIVSGIAAVACIWLFFGFRYEAAGPGTPPIEKFMLPWDEVLSPGGPVTAAIQLTRQYQLLPEAYIEGFAMVRYFGTARAAFLDGAYGTTGWWWFFPAAFLWKSTTVELLSTGALVVLFFVRLRHRRHEISPWLTRCAPLLGFALVFGAFAVASNLNIGHRHILPLYPVLFILAGALVAATPPVWRRRWVIVPLLSAVTAVAIAPHYLTFFNLPSGGPSQGWRKLVDSSLDWGQGLPELSRWVGSHRQPGERLYVSYFGNDSLERHLPEATPLAPIYDHYRPRRYLTLKPGLYCISATMLQDAYSPFRGPWDTVRELDYHRRRMALEPALANGTVENRIVDFGRDGTEPLWSLDRLRFARLAQYLRMRSPDALVANSILVYRLNAHEISTVVDGSTSELAALMAEALGDPPESTRAQGN